MKIDLKRLAAEAASHRVGNKKRPTYPLSFRRKAITALDGVGKKKLADLLGIGVSTLTGWSRSSNGGESDKGTLPRVVELIPAQPSERYDKSKRLVIDVSDGRGKELHLEVPCEAHFIESALAFIQQGFVGKRGV